MGAIIPQRKTRMQLRLTGAAGLISETFPLENCTSAVSAPTSQTIYFGTLGLWAGDVIANIALTLEQLAVGTAPTNAYLGLADKTGKMLAQTADVKSDAGWTANLTTKNFALSSSYTVLTDDVYAVVMLINGTWGTTQPGPMRALNQAQASGSVGAGIFRQGTCGTGQTALPGNGSNLGAFTTASANAYWFGVS